MQITAAVLEEYHRPLVVAELEIDEPRAGEVLVSVVASGVCHTDAIARDQSTCPSRSRAYSATRAPAWCGPSARA